MHAGAYLSSMTTSRPPLLTTVPKTRVGLWRSPKRIAGRAKRAPARIYRGGMRSAPSSLMVSPFSMRFSTIWQASCAYSAGWPRRCG